MGMFIGLATGAAEYGKGSQNERAAQAAALKNQRPVYNIPQEDVDSYRLAQSRASQGMSPQALEAYRQSANQGLGTSVAAMERTGAGPNSLNTSYGDFLSGGNKLAIYDDSARLQNLATLYGQNQRMAANRDKDFQLNQYAPWADKAKAIAAQLAAAKNQEQAGINTMSSAGQGMAKGAGSKPSTPSTPSSASTTDMGGSMSTTSGYGGDYTSAMPAQSNDSMTSYMPSQTESGFIGGSTAGSGIRPTSWDTGFGGY